MKAMPFILGFAYSALWSVAAGAFMGLGVGALLSVPASTSALIGAAGGMGSFVRALILLVIEAAAEGTVPDPR